MKKFSCLAFTLFGGNVDMVPHRLVFEGPTDVPKTETAEAPKEPDTRKYDERMVEAKVDFDAKRQELAQFAQAHEGSTSVEVKNSASVVKKYLEQLNQAEANKKYLDVSQLQANVQRMDKMLGYFEMVQPLEEQKGG